MPGRPLLLHKPRCPQFLNLFTPSFLPTHFPSLSCSSPLLHSLPSLVPTILYTVAVAGCRQSVKPQRKGKIDRTMAQTGKFVPFVVGTILLTVLLLFCLAFLAISEFTLSLYYLLYIYSWEMCENNTYSSHSSSKLETLYISVR